MMSWTETEPRKYTASLGEYTLSVRLSLFGGAAYIVRCVERILGKGDTPMVGEAMKRAEAMVRASQLERTANDVAT